MTIGFTMNNRMLQIEQRLYQIKEAELGFMEMQLDTIKDNQMIIWKALGEQIKIIEENTRQKTFDEMTEEFEEFWFEETEDYDNKEIQ
jgi:hypothetical protein